MVEEEEEDNEKNTWKKRMKYIQENRKRTIGGNMDLK
jgi:hypothetical protein